MPQVDVIQGLINGGVGANESSDKVRSHRPQAYFVFTELLGTYYVHTLT